MNRIRPLSLALLGLLLPLASSASTPVPSPPDCDLPKGIPLVGVTAGVTDPLGEWTVTVRDYQHQPLVNSAVAVDVCTSDIRVCASQPFGGLIVMCDVRRVVAVTNVFGVATLRLVGWAANPGGGTPGAPSPAGAPSPGGGTACANIRADGVLLGTVPVAALDQDGSGGVGTTDLALFLNDRFSLMGTTENRTRSDYDFNGVVDTRDLALWLRVRFAGGSLNSCSSTCP